MNRVSWKVWRTGTASFALLFAMHAAAQLPDAAALLKDARERQQKMDVIRDNYTFHQIATTDDLNDRGAVTKTASEEREVFFVNGRRVGRLVKRNGVPLSETEEKKEQKRVRKLVEQHMKQGPPSHRGGGIITPILAVAKISNPRRLSVNGRPALVYDFTGDPAAHGRDMEQNAVKKTAGTMWFDEADHQVARLEVRFYDNFRVGGGLIASVQKGTAMEMEQSPIGDGLWLLSAREEHLGVRVAFRSFRQNTHVKNFDFKKFNVGMRQEIQQN